MANTMKEKGPMMRNAFPTNFSQNTPTPKIVLEFLRTVFRTYILMRIPKVVIRTDKKKFLMKNSYSIIVLYPVKGSQQIKAISI